MTEIQKKRSGWNFLAYALLAFAGLGIELILAIFLEPVMYGCAMNEWSTWQNISHWIMTCICWGLVCFFLIRVSKHKYGFDVFKYEGKMKLRQWCAVFVILILMLIVSYIDWNGSKVLKELHYNGWLKFIFQYIYYVFEVGLVVLVVVFGQKAFEIWFHKDSRVLIPYGGVLAGITWGLAHVFTKGSLSDGILLVLVSVGYGVTYLLVNRDVKKAYFWILLMFVL